MGSKKDLVGVQPTPQTNRTQTWSLSNSLSTYHPTHTLKSFIVLPRALKTLQWFPKWAAAKANILKFSNNCAF